MHPLHSVGEHDLLSAGDVGYVNTTLGIGGHIRGDDLVVVVVVVVKTIDLNVWKYLFILSLHVFMSSVWVYACTYLCILCMCALKTY